MQTLRQLIALTHRDLIVYKDRIVRYIINYSFTYALMYGLCFGYLLPKIGMSVSAQQLSATIIFVGLILFAINGCAFSINADFLFDIEKDQLTDYFLTIIPYRLLVIQKILFGSVLLFVCMAPYYMFMKLFFYDAFDLSHAHWLTVVIMFYITCLFYMAFSVMFACILKHPIRQLRHFYRRISFPMVILGGLLVPWKTMAAYSKVLGYLVLANPFIYITEGLRCAFITGDYFFPCSICAGMLIFFTMLCLVIGFITFRFKFDPV
jgi:hypothetical protein